jgi:hypothetical protein
VTDLRSWAKRWNDRSLRELVRLPQPRSSGPWPLIGMFAVGLVAGAIGSYAVAQRSQIQRSAWRARSWRDEALGEFGGAEVAKPLSVTSNRSNHRRKAAVEVTQP